MSRPTWDSSKGESSELHADLKRSADVLRSTKLGLESRRHLAALYDALEAALHGDERKAKTILGA